MAVPSDVNEEDTHAHFLPPSLISILTSFLPLVRPLRFWTWGRTRRGSGPTASCPPTGTWRASGTSSSANAKPTCSWTRTSGTCTPTLRAAAGWTRSAPVRSSARWPAPWPTATRPASCSVTSNCASSSSPTSKGEEARRRFLQLPAGGALSRLPPAATVSARFIRMPSDCKWNAVLWGPWQPRRRANRAPADLHAHAHTHARTWACRE